jgi:putative membrane protein
MVIDAARIPYCGAPPSPLTLLSRWNLDPVLLVLLGALLLAGLAAGHAGRARWQTVCLCGGWAVCAVALISPLCALSVALFSARLGQHMILETIGAPLIALGLCQPGQPAAGRHDAPLIAALVFAATLWFWHAPGPYAATFRGAPLYWLMHATAFAAALWLWRAALAAVGSRPGTSLAALLVTTLQMGFLGALLTFSVRPYYPVHAYTTGAWGLSPTQDQQLGGLVMWVPTSVIFVAAIVGAVAVMLRYAQPAPVGMARR